MKFEKTFFVLLMILTAITASAAEQSAENAKQNLSQIFQVAVAPMSAYKTLAQQDRDYLSKNFGPAVVSGAMPEFFNTEVVEADANFCLEQTEQAYWKSWVPFAGAKYRVKGNWYSQYIKIENAVHARDPRCEKFQLGFYKNFPQFLKTLPKTVPGTDQPIQNGFLYAALPASFISDVVLQTFSIKTLAGLQGHMQSVISSMSASAHRPDLSPMEVCAAVAIGDVATDASASIKEMQKDVSVINGDLALGSGRIGQKGADAIRLYQARVRFLAFSINDWIAKTNGNTNLCPNFGLELQVNELESRVTAAEQRLNNLSSEVSDLHNEVAEIRKRQNSDEILGTVAFWALGFAGYRMITPL